MQRGTSTEILIGGRHPASIPLWNPNCHSKTAAAICSRVAAAGWTSRTSTYLLPFSFHAQYQGYWTQLGMQLQELVAYAFEESVRIKKKGLLFPNWHEIPARSSRGILQEVQALLQKYRSELVRQSRLLDQGDRA